MPQNVSIVICSYTLDRFVDLLAAVASALNQSPPPEQVVVVIDHNEALLEEVRRAVPEAVEVVANRFARGLSGARNTGVAVSRGETFFFLDDDAIADRHCAAALMARCADRSVIGAGAKIEPLFLAPRPRWFPERFLWVVGCTYEGLEPGPVRNLLGAAMCLNRETFERIGGFDGALGRGDSALPFGCEETEFCIRASQAFPGGRFLYEPNACVAHKVPPERLTLAYLVRRCFAEGVSKAILTRKTAASRSLDVERSYVLRTIWREPAAALGDFVLRGDPTGFLRAWACILGIASAAAGFALQRSGLWRIAQAPSVIAVSPRRAP